MNEMPGVDAPITESRSRERPRLVMIIDNRVVGDSRVEKSAATAVAAGYDTYVIGRAFLRTREETDVAGGRLIRFR
jgi:glycogen(starch) synthase